MPLERDRWRSFISQKEMFSMLEQTIDERLLMAAPLPGVLKDFQTQRSPICMSKMIAYICHDLRLPLSAILANAEFLKCADLSEMERNGLYLEICEAIDQMNEMISSLLEYSKGGDIFRPVVGSIVDTIDRAIRMAKMKQECRHISIEYRHKGLAIGWFDAHRIQRAVVNLVTNAIEAVSPESGRIVLNTAGTSSRLEIAAWDNGPGIHPTIQDSLFQPFVRYGKPEGSGLGLAIAKKIIEDHGGRIYLDRNSKTGTLFRISLPFAIPERTMGSGL